MTVTIRTESEMTKAIDAFNSFIGELKIVFLYGDLGAGKTTFVKSLVKHLGTEDEASSPTYSLVNEYKVGDNKLYHIDLYRLNDTHEAMDIGIEDYLYSGNFVFIEWPQIIEHIVEDAAVIQITTGENNERIFEFERIRQ